MIDHASLEDVAAGRDLIGMLEIPREQRLHDVANARALGLGRRAHVDLFEHERAQLEQRLGVRRRLLDVLDARRLLNEVMYQGVDAAGGRGAE